MKYMIGIDIGKKGAISILHRVTKEVKFLEPIPLLADGDVDGNKLLDLFALYLGDCHCCIEKLHAMPFFGAKGNFGFGGQYYTIKTILRVSKTPFTEVMARVWQKQLFSGMKVIKKTDGKTTDTKKMASIRAQNLFPNEKFVATDRCKNLHSGMIDSILIAYYGAQNIL